MENNRNNYEKNKYSAQIRGEQISNLEKEKSNNKLADKIENGLNIHSMPNSFRAGKFNTSVHPNEINKKDNSKKISNKSKHKYVGILIIVVGILILGGLGYFLYTYITDNPQDNNQVVYEDDNNDNKQAQEQEKDEESNKDEDNDEGTVNIDGEDTLDEEDNNEIDENIDFEDDINEVENGTSTDETATSTEDVDEEVATSTEDVVAVKDTDGDGLTDLEEHLLNTNINLEDSDSDTHNDAHEVINLYNPAGTNKLIDNPGISEYSNPLHNYTILHPQTWTQRVSNEGDSVMFMNENEGFFQVSVEVNSESLNIEDWYRQEFNIEEGETLNYYSEDNEMISSSDGLFVYYTDAENIYVFSYTVMSANPSYPTIFKAFVNSFNLY